MAQQFAHLTAAQAAALAKEAGVGHLILTHLSRRYRERDVYQEAQEIFPNTIVARDFDVFQIKRGILYQGGPGEDLSNQPISLRKHPMGCFLFILIFSRVGNLFSC